MVNPFPSAASPSDARYRIGIDLGGTKIEGLLLDLAGQEVQRLRRPTPQGDYQGTLTAIAALVADLEAGVPKSAPLATVGVGMPGTVEPATGLVKNANSVVLNGKPFPDDLARLLGRPVRTSNDANCFIVSEATDGAAAGARVAFGVILGTGVGGGVAIDGRVIDGCNGVAGEWGHNPLPWTTDPQPPACYCGKAGCIETYLSGPGLARDHGTGQTAAEIVAAAEAGDARAEATLIRWEDRLARALVTVIHVLDPDVIVLGGGLSQVPRWYRTLPPKMAALLFGGGTLRTRLVPPRHGDSSGVRGAAWLWSD